MDKYKMNKEQVDHSFSNLTSQDFNEIGHFLNRIYSQEITISTLLQMLST